MTRYIKVRLECILPVPPEIAHGELDAVAESGLSALRTHLAQVITTMVPGTLFTSWQSMPQSWRPKREPVIQEEVAPGFFHTIDSDERISFVDIDDPTIDAPALGEGSDE
jgi:hypothetical protein